MENGIKVRVVVRYPHLFGGQSEVVVKCHDWELDKRGALRLYESFPDKLKLCFNSDAYQTFSVERRQ